MVFVDVVRALYDYPANSAEELTISENDILFVLEKSTEDDWWKCKRKAASDDDEEPEGLVPNNYVEKVQPSKAAKALYDYSKQTDEELSFEEGTQLEVYDERATRIGRWSGHGSQAMSSPPPTARSPPAMAPSPQPNRYTPNTSYPDPDEIPSSPSGFRIYNIHEMVSHLGKSRKMPTILGLNISKGVIMISPEKSKDGPSKEWSAEKLTHYSIEGKHVFVELVRPSKSVDFHAGSKDTAQEIVAHLGELAGAVRAEGLREIYTGCFGLGIR
ncbi:hypothetical protein BTJ68_10264, partial [Hortaea werneckii EXF-2000]